MLLEGYDDVANMTYSELLLVASGLLDSPEPVMALQSMRRDGAGG